MKPQTRFSFFEALILFLILGTIGSIAGPLLQRLGDNADLAKCRGNLYLLGAATHLYASEHEGLLPEFSIFSTAEFGTYVGDGRMYGRLLPKKSGGHGENDRDYLGTAHPLMCPSLSPAVYAGDATYKRPEKIDESNPIFRMGYVYMYHAQNSPSGKANNTINANPHAPLCMDFGWANTPPGLVGQLMKIPSHPEVMNVLHLGGHVTTFPLDEANQSTNWRSLYDALLENSSR